MNAGAPLLIASAASGIKKPKEASWMDGTRALYEAMDKDEWMALWDGFEAERREQVRLTEKYQHHR